MSKIQFPLLIIQTWNLLICLCYNNHRTHHHKEPAFNEESSPDNDEFTSLYLISPPNCYGDFNVIGGYTFGCVKQSVLVVKPYLESMMDESGFVAATKMGGFSLDKVSEVSLAPELFWTSIFTSSASVRAADKLSISNHFFYSSSLNTNPPKIILLLLQSL